MQRRRRGGVNGVIRLRLATAADLPALRALIPASVRALSVGYYTPQQAESAIRYIFGPDTQLIADGTYFVAESDGGEIVGCGGWSRRRTLFGGDQMKNASPHLVCDDLLDPASDAARIRAFFVAAGWERRGIGSRLLAASADAARAAGFTRLELGATPPGVPFYRAHGFTADATHGMTLPDGTAIAFVQMSYKLDAHSCPTPPHPTARDCGS